MAATFKATFVSQDCSAGWCYKAGEQYGKAKDQNIVSIFVFLEAWSMVLGTICCYVLVLCPTWEWEKGICLLEPILHLNTL